MKILVTGANGYLGQGIVKQLLDDGAEVFAVDFNLDFVDDRAKKLSCDLFSVESPYEYFECPDVLLHLAWRDGFVHNSPNHLNDLAKHYAFIESMIKGGLKQVAVLGTMHEIGFYEGAIDENTFCKPLNLYGVAKNALRGATEYLCKTNDVVFQWLRGYYIVGNSKFGNSIFSKITSAVEEGKKEFPFTTGKNKYDFLDYDEFAVQVSAAVMQSDVNGIINICSGKPVSLADRVEQFITENNYDIKLKYGAFPDRAYDSDAVWGNSEKIEKILKVKGM
ncbi:MAG: NAD(P)-dependent oxidoreductase [Clostridia bacterium]|nr:NAD(P)-dependent oxidoreductase [Clostridia bacterium]